jgi:phosphoglycolate phosphatase-like HAD superfamily hydrolase
VVNSGDVEQSKPGAGHRRAALKEVGVEPQNAVMLGDTVYDVRAANARASPASA